MSACLLGKLLTQPQCRATEKVSEWMSIAKLLSAQDETLDNGHIFIRREDNVWTFSVQPGSTATRARKLAGQLTRLLAFGARTCVVVLRLRIDAHTKHVRLGKEFLGMRGFPCQTVWQTLSRFQGGQHSRTHVVDDIMLYFTPSASRPNIFTEEFWWICDNLKDDSGNVEFFSLLKNNKQR